MTLGRRALLLGVAAGIAVGAALGAWIDWRWWNPVYGMQIVVILGSVLLLAVAGIAWKVARRARPLALVAVALVVGIAGGLAFGPSRETPRGYAGTMTLTVEGPVAAEAIWVATCSIVPSGTQLIVTAGESQPISIGSNRHAMPEISLGDMWSTGAADRQDGLGVRLLMIDASFASEADGPAEYVLRSTPTSTLEATVEGQTGSIRFAGLSSQRPVPAGDPLADLAGTISWTCDTQQGAY